MSTHQALEAYIASLQFNRVQDAARIRHLEKLLETRATPLWKRMLFRLDGWGPWWQVRPAPRWRPWRRWWTS